MRNIGYIFILMILFSCNFTSFEKQLTNFAGTEIIFPDSLQASFKGLDTMICISDAPMKMVVWYDSVGCSSCRIQHIHEWNEIVFYANKIGDVFDPVFIFSPKASDLHGIRIALRTVGFEYPVYIDNGNFFSKNNPHIPSNKRMHTFLLDENNKVVLVGSPVRNEPLWELYKEQIQLKIKH